MGSGETCQLASVDRCGSSQVTATISPSPGRELRHWQTEIIMAHPPVLDIGGKRRAGHSPETRRWSYRVYCRAQLTVSTEKTVGSALVAPPIKQEDRLSIPHPKCLGPEVFQISYFHILSGAYILGSGPMSEHEICFICTLYK